MNDDIMDIKCQNCGTDVAGDFQFCLNCGNMLTKMDIIAHYFMRGFKYSTILLFLREFHNTQMSMQAGFKKAKCSWV